MMRPEYQNLHSYFQEIKEQYAQAKTTQEKLDLLNIASEILKQAQEQVAQLQDEIDGMRKSWVDFERRDNDLHLLHDLSRILIFAERHEFGMPESVGLGTVKMVSQLTENSMKRWSVPLINQCDQCGAPVSAFLHTVRGYPPGGFMDILAALRQEEAKWEKEVSAAKQQLDNVRAAMKLLDGMGSSGKATASSGGKTTGAMSSSGKTTGGKKRVMSAAAKARISKASKDRWAKFRAAKAKGK